MFMDEFSPVFKEILGHPVAFLGGFVSGLLRLNLAEDPVKSWLDQQSGATTGTTTSVDSPNSKNSGPQSISIE
jgi:hypothetical protein